MNDDQQAILDNTKLQHVCTLPDYARPLAMTTYRDKVIIACDGGKIYELYLDPVSSEYRCRQVFPTSTMQDFMDHLKIMQLEGRLTVRWDGAIVLTPPAAASPAG